MNKDLATAIVSAVIGLVIAFFATNMFIGEIEPFPVKTIDAASVNVELKDPNPEVFNYRALNPTVEVYIGSCAEYNELGECIEIFSDVENADQSDDTGETF